MPKIIGPRPHATTRWLLIRLSGKSLAGWFPLPSLPAVCDGSRPRRSDRRVLRQRRRAAPGHICPALGTANCERVPNRARPFKLLDEEKSLARIDISHPEAERFPKTQPGAVEQQNQGSVQASPEPRPIQWLAGVRAV